MQDMWCCKLCTWGLHGHPGMAQHFCGRVTKQWILHQQVADQTRSLLGHSLPLIVWEVVLAVLDALEERVLALEAALAFLPTAVLTTMTIEWWVAT